MKQEFCDKLLEAAKAAPHDHSKLGHPQTGNPFCAWSRDCQWLCDLCLMVKLLEGKDLALEFSNAIPFTIRRVNLHSRWQQDDFDAWFWKRAYLKVLKLLDDPFDRQWVREHLAESLSRGMREARDEGRALAWVGE